MISRSITVPTARVLGVYLRRTTTNRHFGIGISDAQTEIEPSVLADVEFDSVADDRLKGVGMDRNPVHARAERKNAVKAVVVRFGHTPAAGLFVTDSDLCPGHFQPGRIPDQSGELSILTEQ